MGPRSLSVSGESAPSLSEVFAALKKVYGGKPGIVWMDAHGDFDTPETTPSGFIGGMFLALACGRGPRLSRDIKRTRPLLEEERESPHRVLSPRPSRARRQRDLARSGGRSVRRSVPSPSDAYHRL